MRYASLVGFLLLAVGGGLLVGIVSGPGPWYQALEKPPFNPPNWVFGPVWTTLYILIGIAGWRTWLIRPHGNAMNLWWAQMLLNFAWTPVFFSLQSPGLAIVVILLMLLSILGFIALSWNRDRLASILFIPYAAWVAFATLLNVSIWWLN